MKIAFLSFYSGHVYRGVETYVHELGNELTKRDYLVTVYQKGKELSGTHYNSVSVDSVSIREFTTKALSSLDPETDVVVATNGGWQSFLCKIWCVQHGKKLVIPGQAGPGFDDWLNLWVFPDCFVGLTDYQCAWARKVNPLVKVIKIPNGVDLKKFNRVGGGLKINLPEPLILCVAALVPMKRLDLAIKAVSRLSKGSLLIVGKGEQEEYLKQLGDKMLAKRFQILSFAHTQMPQVYKSANLFTFPTSPWESFGIVMLEAMASGLPVVAGDDPIRREIVGDAGLFVNPENTQEYAQALEKALTADWGNKPRLQAEKFSWDKSAAQYDNLFRSLVT